MSETERKGPTAEERIAETFVRSLPEGWLISDHAIEGIATLLRAAVLAERFDAYDRARELVGFSPNACHVIEAQMQEEFPDRAFVPSTQERSSRMDGSNLRMPKTPNQFREEGRLAEREECAVMCEASATSEEQTKMPLYFVQNNVLRGMAAMIRARVGDTAQVASETSGDPDR